MKLDDLLYQNSEWLRGTGPRSGIVMSSRIRLARNVDGLPFSHWADKKKEEEILSLIEPAVRSSRYLKKMLFLRLDKLSDMDKQFLLERHLVSREHAEGKNHKAVVISKQEVVSIMVNEEDHLRIQVLQSGFNLLEAWRLTAKIDRELETKLNFAFDHRWGYLTACPTNVGTGLRASVMLHLPALVMTKQINKVLQALDKLSVAARGLYGEGTEASGNLFQFSNQITLGHSEEELLDNVERVVRQIVAYENEARRTVMSRNKERVSDRIWRSYGTLKSAHLISSSETIGLLSMIRLGVDIGLLKSLDKAQVNRLFILSQPAHLQKIEGKVLTPMQRDIKRADLLRRELGEK
ncbi:MAG: protein arginine kinase [Candidatus Omnitrophota bacterium]|nr:protein arginine kinase [Candidatus Omnitrophota bacterium]